MDGIPGEVIFVLLFIGLSIMEGLGRRRKAQQQKGAPGKPPAPRPRTPAPDQLETRELGAGTPDTRMSGPRSPAGKEAGSEGLIPAEVWDEILGLARGGGPEPRRWPPQTESNASSGIEDGGPEDIHTAEARSLEPVHLEDEREVSRPERVPVLAGSTPPAHRSTAARRASGARAVAAAKGEQATPGDQARIRSRGPVKGKGLFGAGTPEELRKAIVLREVLGPPVGLRE
jgi:hypothetical protein